MCLGIPGQVIGPMPGELDFLRVSVGGVERRVHGGLLDGDPPRSGDWVLIHLGFALERMTPEEASDALALMAELGEGEPENETEEAPWSPAA